MEKFNLVPVFNGPLSDFPASDEMPEGVKSVTLQDTFNPAFRFIPDIVYAQRTGETQRLHLLLPEDNKRPDANHPLIVFVQGSAWHRQNAFQHLPHMIWVCQQGYAVALIEYRPSDIAPFPAQAQDAKTAIRFLRMHAAEYRIDADRVALWGDSSGGHTAVMAGVTANRAHDSDLYGEYPCDVRCIVDWYGPMDIAKMNLVPSTQDHTGPDSPEGFLIGRKNVLENPKLAAQTVPMNYISRDVATPPILILHGTRDQLVAFNQSCLLYEHLRSLDKEVEMYRVEGAYHGFGGFHSIEALQISVDFLKKHL